MDWHALWRGKERCTVFDSGRNASSRYQAALAHWRADPQRPAHLHYLALGEAPMPGFLRQPQTDPGVSFDLLATGLDSALSQLDARLDAIVLHDMQGQGSGFARALARLAEPGAVLVAHGLSDTQAHALGGAGFACTENGAGRITATFTTRKPPSPWARKSEAVRRAIVLGAGLAGAAACERLVARGWQVTLVERHAQPAAEASGNQAGIYMPLLSKDDNIMTRLSRAALLYARAYWEQLGGVGPGRRIAGQECGVLQLARDPAHADVQRAIAALGRTPAAYAEWLDAERASALLGAPAPNGGWWFGQAGWVRPASACAAMLDACGPALSTIFNAGTVSLAHDGQAWTVHDGGGAPLCSAPVVVLANGAGALTLAQSATLPLLAVRGQVTHLAQGGAPRLPFVLCREAYLTPAIDGWHSLGASYDDDANPALRAASQHENLAKIATMVNRPGIGADAPLAGRVGFRSVAPDRLPLVGALPAATVAGRVERLREVARQPGLYGLLGYASRGLIWAPLAAELLASQLDGDPLPLEAELATALDPARFLLRARRQAL